MPRLAVFGDSFVRRFGEYLEKTGIQLYSPYTTSFYGKGGMRAEYYDHRLLGELLRFKPTVVIVMLGGNDITPVSRHKDIFHQICHLVETIRRGGVSQVYIVEITPRGDFHAINTKDALSIREVFQKGGQAAVNALKAGKLNQWKECIINVGVMGNAGVGKSSFINALRGLTADDDGAAEVGPTETTMKPTQYRHPGNENMLLWDLPGGDTPSFQRDKYLDEVHATLYDYFIIISASRFTDFDRWLGEQLPKMNKKFYFVRTKTGSDVSDDKRSHPRTHDEKELIENIRRDCLKHLGNTKYIGTVYLIDNFETNKYDFNSLCLQLVADASELMKEAMLFTLGSLSADVIVAKKDAMDKRIFIIAVASGIAGAIPIPGLDVAVDIAALVEEANFYKQQFGLSDEVLERFGKPLELGTRELQFTKQGITTYMVSALGFKKLTQYGAEKLLKYIFPGYGSFVSGVASYSYCSATLYNLLDMCGNDALKISKFGSDIVDQLQ